MYYRVLDCVTTTYQRNTEVEAFLFAAASPNTQKGYNYGHGSEENTNTECCILYSCLSVFISNEIKGASHHC